MFTSKINISPEIEKLDGTHFNWLIQRWLDHVAETCSARTRSDYGHTIKYFSAWWAGYGPANEYVLSKPALIKFNRHLDGLRNKRRPSEGLAWNTRNDALRRVGQVLRFAHAGGYIDRDYADWIPAPTGRLPEREPLPRDILPRLLQAAELAGNPSRARCVIALLGGTGMRRGEAVALNVEDISHDGQVIDHILVRARLKNSRTRAVGIAADAMPYVISHIANRQTGPLFIGENGKGRATAKTIYRDCIEVQTLAGIELSRPCHDLRVAFATHWARTNRGETMGNLLSKQLGHSHFDTTRRFYIQTDIDDIRQVMINPFREEKHEPTTNN